jgi:hypothetical protein
MNPQLQMKLTHSKHLKRLSKNNHGWKLLLICVHYKLYAIDNFHNSYVYRAE